MSKKIINISKQKLAQLEEMVWYPDEEIVIAVESNIQMNEKEIPFSGILVVTYGAYYVIKTTMFGSMELIKTIPFLRCHDLCFRHEKIIIKCGEDHIHFKLEDKKAVCIKIVTIYLEITYKIKNPPKLKIKSDIKVSDITLDSRPSNISLHRIIALSHYFDEKSPLYANYAYLDFSSDKSVDAILQPNFQYGNMPKTFGTYIGWENKYEALFLQVYNPPNFMEIFNSILTSAQRMSRIVFSDYKDSQIPEFDFSNTKETSVNKFMFNRSCGKLIESFLMSTEEYPIPIDEIGISICTMRPQEFGDIVTNISLSEPAKNIRKFTMNRVFMKPFPFDDINRLLNIATNLDTIVLRGLEIDGTYLLKSLLDAKSNVRQISIRAVVFKNKFMKGIPIPSSLVLVNVSQCSFNAQIFKSFIELFTDKLLPRPIVLLAQSLVMKGDVYAGLAHLNYEKLAPNFSEIDFSGNGFALETMKYFFAFLFSQSRMHLLSLNDVYSDNTAAFLTNLSALIKERKLYGIEISGRFADALFANFITTLTLSKELKHVKIKANIPGEYSLVACRTLVEELPNLVEFGADGFLPRDPEPFLDLWITVAKMKNILTIEIPTEDMGELGMSFSRMGNDISPYFNVLKNKPRMSNVLRRVRCIIDSPEKVPFIPENEMDIPSDTIDEEMEKYIYKDIFINSLV